MIYIYICMYVFVVSKIFSSGLSQNFLALESEVYFNLIWTIQFRVNSAEEPFSLFLYRSVISYKTDEKPIFSFETVAGSGKWGAGNHQLHAVINNKKSTLKMGIWY